jgi:hypothetical protein
MKSQSQTVIEHLNHALVWIREARETGHEELRKQHLDEAERLIAYAIGVMDGKTEGR